MTPSPVSRWGVYSGLCLPRSRLATRVAKRPKTTVSASTRCHLWWMDLTAGKNVFIGFSRITGARLILPVARRSCQRAGLIKEVGARDWQTVDDREGGLLVSGIHDPATTEKPRPIVGIVERGDGYVRPRRGGMNKLPLADEDPNVRRPGTVSREEHEIARQDGVRLHQLGRAVVVLRTHPPQGRGEAGEDEIDQS